MRCRTSASIIGLTVVGALATIALAAISFGTAALAVEPGRSSRPSASKPAPADEYKEIGSSADSKSDDKYERIPVGASVLVKIPDEMPPGAKAGAGDVAVGRVYLAASDGYVVMLPSGQLRLATMSEVTPTDRPFVPATKDQLAAAFTETGPFKGFKTKQTKRFLYVYNSSDIFYTGTSRILETMYPGLLAYCKRLKLNCEEAELPLVVIMFRQQEEFNRYRKMPEGVIAYYDGKTNYIVMYEMSSLAKVAPDIAVKQAVSTVAHEGVHQILQNIGVQQRLSRWPMWISEGIAEYFAPTDTTKEARWMGIGHVNDLRMSELKRYALSRGGFDSNTIRDTATAQQLTSTGYASAWALTHFLAQKRADEFLGYLQEVSQRAPLESFTKEDDEAVFIKHFGKDYALLSELLFKHLNKLPFRDPLAEARIIIVPSKTTSKRSK